MGRAAVCYCGTPWTFLLPFVVSVLCVSLVCVLFCFLTALLALSTSMAAHSVF